MASRSEAAIVYFSGVVQGIGLVTYPAAAAVFASPSDFALSSTEYGALFLPQTVLATAASLAGAGLRRRLGTKNILLLGLLANLAAMALFVLGFFVMHRHAAAYGILLLSTACMGVGFGFAVPALNTFASAFFPQKADKAVLALNASLGLGTSLAPVFTAVCIGLGIGWGLPALAGLLMAALLPAAAKLSPISGESTAPSRAPHPNAGTHAVIPTRFWLFASFSLLYGVCEAMNGNWASLYLNQHFHSDKALSSIVLTLFWSMVTLGRIFFVVVEKWLPEAMVFRILPVVVAAALLASACAPASSPITGLLAFALAGFGCSALLPLVISFGQAQLAAISASVAGGLIAFYETGYGLAAFGVGPLQSRAGFDLGSIYGGTTVAALAMCVLSFAITRKSRAGQARTGF